MLSSIRRQFVPQLQRQCRSMTQAAAETESRLAAVTKQSPVRTSASASVSQKPYYIPRNGQGNLPVYSDLRNAGSRYLVLVRNVEGSISSLAKDLSKSLFPEGSYEAEKMKIQISQGKHLVISGGNLEWKTEVTRWLQKKGF